VKVILECQEGASALYRGTLVDETGIAIPAGQITDMRLLLYNASSSEGDVINERDGSTNVLTDPASGVTMHATNGLVTWQLSPEDNPIADHSLPYERHVALLQFDFGTNGRGWHEIVMHVANRRKLGQQIPA